MKRKLLSPILGLIFGSLIVSSCSGGDDVLEPTDQTPPTTKIAILDSRAADGIRVQIEVSSNTARYEFAIGTGNDREAFLNGTLDRQSITGNENTDYTFTQLESDSGYYIYARAFSSVDNAELEGPVAVSFASTGYGEIAVSTSRTGYQMLCFNIDGVPNISSIEYKLVTEVNEAIIAGFENEEIQPEFVSNDSKYGLPIVYNAYTATYFNLEPETTYYLLVRGVDRYSNEFTNTLVFSGTTESKEGKPTLDIEVGALNDFWITSIKYTMKESTSSYFVYYTEQGILESYYLSMVNYSGDYFAFIRDSYNDGGGSSTYYVNKELWFQNETFEPGRTYEFYALLIDENSEPCELLRLVHTIPNNESAGVANVSATVTPTVDGGTYTFTPNDATVAFICETFTTEYIQTLGYTVTTSTTEEQDSFLLMEMYYYMTINLYPSFYGGTKWQYRYIPEYWTLTWNDDSDKETQRFPSGTELELVILPFNANGLEGIGEVKRFKYTKL